MRAAREARHCMVNNQNFSTPPTRQQRIDQHRQKVLGTRLRTLYADVAAEQTPESFLRLLEQADQPRKN